ncbi:MAG: YraN family protein [Clostridium sp.]|nr:YraN family protein [Clostridium sp.]
MARHNELGAWGEQLAAEHMIKLGWAIAERNIRVGKYEIDIVATRGSDIAFVEVKTRSDDFIDPVDVIDDKKIRHMARAADSFMRIHDVLANPRFDVITVIGTPEAGYRLTHYPDSIIPPLDAL